MALTRTQIRQEVGRELGIVFPGTATAVDAAGAVRIDDTSDDSPFDPGDDAVRYNGAGVYIIDSDADRYWRQNLTYTPGSQRISWSGALSPVLTDTTPDYELHTEPILHPLLVWPSLINDALALIRFISFKYINLSSHRDYYDLDFYSDIIGVERMRRLYYVGDNLLRNPEFQWTQGGTTPANWTPTGIPGKTTKPNTEYAALLNTTEALDQVISIRGPKRLRGSINVDIDTATGISLSLTARFTDGSTERLITGTQSSDGQLIVDIETTHETASVLYHIESAGGDAIVWLPAVYDLSLGIRKRIQPATLVQHDATSTAPTIRMYAPSIDGVGQFALLLPYPALASDTATTTAPDELVKAAVAVQVLRWLVSNPQIVDKSEYTAALMIWSDRFNNRSREHMRKIQKTQQLWEWGEVSGRGSSMRKRI